ncbi:hypothetical protein SPRG_13027 [Saprolegnia parasitica CBS 223.65]|uniref:Uncharacterized protein n=1 Tax=Saprolegnia parasitica (strain CBS 223.65) TaxID=695850 RepID=A0A067BT86_SAPPC|nr:hypothetical protein SPRG_13027 [Saprolegnia parasitica CBS 223.65]KDO21689.1 hypothetical protein SPRG_13027 [Saprolegnia parasitica CBS 223.65]|eukprot:XP_012207611.1 hypothetical protein SPRG_13027 [Saprolegnia parasitica CBS 223.65]
MSLVESLRHVSPEAFARTAADLLDALQRENDQACAKCEAKLTRLSAQLTQATTARADAVAQHRSTLNDKAMYDQRLTEHEASIRMHQGNVAREHAEIHRLGNVIRTERQRQSNAAYDLIPLHGFFAGLISGDLRRTIPFYSQIDGLISVAENDLGAAQRRLEGSKQALARLCSDLALTRAAQSQTQAQIGQLNDRLDALQRQIQGLDRETTSTGQQLTQLHEVRMAVLKLRTKYGLTASRVALVATIKKDFIKVACLEDVQRLVQQHSKALHLL